MDRTFRFVAKERIPFAAILFFGLLAFTARPATDPDLWWHLRTGQWILANHQVPRVDPFSFTRAGAPWISHEWLSEILFYTIWRVSSWAGLIVFASIITTAGFMVLYQRCRGPRHWAAAAVTLGAFTAAPTWGVRPQMFTFLFTSLFLWVIEKGEHRPRWLLALPALFLLWVNLHAGFALGLAIVSAYCVGLVWEVVSGETSWPTVRGYVAMLLLAMAGCAFLVPVNPSGAELYRYPFDTLRSEGMRRFIVEWASPDFHAARFLPFASLCLVLIAALAISHRKPRGRVLVPLLGLLAAGLDATRHIPIFVLLAVPALPLFVDHESSSIGRPSFPGSRVSQIRLHAAVVVLIIVFVGVRWVTLFNRQGRFEADLYPAGAVRSLKADTNCGRLFAYYDWGGYAIWHLYPKCRVFVDGRADLYGDKLLDQFKEVVGVGPDWRGVLDQWEIEAVMVPPTAGVVQALALDPAWELRYRDSKAVVFVRNRPFVSAAEPKRLLLGEPKKMKKCLPQGC